MGSPSAVVYIGTTMDRDEFFSYGEQTVPSAIKPDYEFPNDRKIDIQNAIGQTDGPIDATQISNPPSR